MDGEQLIQANRNIETNSDSTNRTTETSANNEQFGLVKSLSEIVSNLVMGRPAQPRNNPTLPNFNANTSTERKLDNKTTQMSDLDKDPSSRPPMPKRACRPPLSRKFGHPCQCGYSNHHKTFVNVNGTGSLPPAAYTSPLYLFDSLSKKCYPTSRHRDMLLKECQPPHHHHHSHQNSTLNNSTLNEHIAGKPFKSLHGTCYYDDLACDPRRYRCTCKPSLHLYYESTNPIYFGCVPLTQNSSSDGRLTCRPGYVINGNGNECQKIFDVGELPSSHATGVSATQFSFVTVVLIWILLLILIVTAKLRKLQTSTYYSGSPATQRRQRYDAVHRRRNQTSVSNWLNPLISAVGGHHISQHRTTVDRHGTTTLDDNGSYNDTDFFLSNGNRALHDRLGNNNRQGSQQSINNPPPKFEEIYPTCPEERQRDLRIPSNEDLPTYDEAMKLENTMPVDHQNRHQPPPPPPPPPPPKD